MLRYPFDLLQTFGLGFWFEIIQPTAGPSLVQGDW